MNVFIFIFGMIAISNTGWCSVETWISKPNLDGTPAVRFEMPYTFGTHEGFVKEIRGEVQADFEKNKILEGSIAVRLSDVRMENPKITCHLWESLGLDYRRSDFPARHVCDEKNLLPETGKNALSYPEIRFSWKEAKILRESSEIEAVGAWRMHGTLIGPQPFLYKFKKVSETICELVGEQKFVLLTYNILVKSFFLSQVGESARVFYRIRFEKN